MKNLNKKVSAIALSGMMIMGVAASSQFRIYANDVQASQSSNIYDILKRKGYNKPDWFVPDDEIKSEWVNSNASDIADIEGGQRVYDYNIIYHEQLNKSKGVLEVEKVSPKLKQGLDKNKSMEYNGHGGLVFDYLESCRLNLSSKLGSNWKSVISESPIVVVRDGEDFFNYLKKHGGDQGIKVFVVGNQLAILKFNKKFNPGIDVYNYIGHLSPSDKRDLAQVLGNQKIFEYWVVAHSRNEDLYENFEEIDLKDLGKFKSAVELIGKFLFDNERPNNPNFYKVKVGQDYFVIQFRYVDFKKSAEKIMEKYKKYIINYYIK